jgi:hypothetical protein
LSNRELQKFHLGSNKVAPTRTAIITPCNDQTSADDKCANTTLHAELRSAPHAATTRSAPYAAIRTVERAFEHVYRVIGHLGSVR